MQPIVNGLEAGYGEQINFVYMNVADEGMLLFEALNLPGHPSIVVFTAAGEETYRAFGVVEAEQIRTEIAQILTEDP